MVICAVSCPCPSATLYSTQEDPIGLAGGLNLYGYGDGDPINNSDPFGLCCFLPAGAVKSIVNQATTEVALRNIVHRAAHMGGNFKAYARGNVGVSAGQVEVDALGRYAGRTAAVVSTTAIGGHVGMRFDVNDAPENSVGMRVSTRIGAVGGFPVGLTSTFALPKNGSDPIMTSFGFELGLSLGRTPTGRGTPVGVSVAVPGTEKCSGTACTPP